MKDAFYFPHFCNARHDRKLRRVRKELGLEGYGIFFMILEVLREQADYKYPVQDIDLLADEFGTSEQKVKTVVSNYQLFQVDDDEKFFSFQLITNLQPFLDGKKNKQLAGIRGNLIRHKYITKEQSDTMNSDEIMQKYNDLGMGSHCDSIAIAIKERKQTKETNKPYNPDYIRVVELLIECIEDNDPKHFKNKDKNKTIENWYDPIRLLVERDGRDIDIVEKVLIWSQEDIFWKTNILSTGKFRKQFPSLLMKYKSTSKDIKNEEMKIDNDYDPTGRLARERNHGI